ncbi:MAG TPA: BREX-1 system adenine-specific DNA-methyltransferase PglX, partial [Oscillospiraceae bacterium]|nr:BREX-1 system adenine-specific DNA-methyltransferase PglX [Oscillospiraceae bacterium]
VDIITFVAKKNMKYENSKFINLDEKNILIDDGNKEFILCDLDIYEKNIEDFKKIPGYNFAYWVGDKTIENFRLGEKLEKLGLPRQGMATTDNARFLRNWYEVNFDNINLSNIDKYIPGYKWYPYNKGGGHRNWYGNNQTVINWDNNGYEVKELAKSKYGSETRTIKNQKFYFREGITYSFIGTTVSARETGKGFLFDVAGSTIFLNDKKFFEYLLALLYSVVSDHYMNLLNPTINIQVGNIKNIPIILNDAYKSEIDSLVRQNISISKIDWDFFETSWDFRVHPLLDKNKQGQVPDTIKSAYENLKEYCNRSFAKLKENEERLNELFIEIYNLEDELKPNILARDITVAKIFDSKRDMYEDIKGSKCVLIKEDIIKSFISYGVGCIFGRYSLDEQGLVYAGGNFDINRYKKFKPTRDNVVIITDGEYFEDDLVNRFIQFVGTSFGKINLGENLKFIADSLKGAGTPREKIRDYFMNDFYKDHVRMYKKTPIYWLYDSSAGKTKRQSANGFKALIYIHRYNKDTTGKVRLDYLHKMQRIYEIKTDFLKAEIVNNGDIEEITKLEKELVKTTKQLNECKDYDKKIERIAVLRISIDHDDGVKTNHDKVQIDDKGEKHKILAGV